MSCLVGKYVRSFAEADTGLLQGVSLNAPYDFFWVQLQRVEGDQIICTGAGKEMRLPIRRGRTCELAKVTVEDPLFGPQQFDVAPLLSEGGTPIGGSLGL